MDKADALMIRGKIATLKNKATKSFVFSDAAMERLLEIKQILNVNSLGEVIRRAMITYDCCLAAEERGEKITFVSVKGAVTEFKLPGNVKEIQNVEIP